MKMNKVNIIKVDITLTTKYLKILHKTIEMRYHSYKTPEFFP